MDLVIHAGTLSVRDPSKDHFVERFAPFPLTSPACRRQNTTRASSAAEPRVLHAALMPQIDVPRARRFFVLRPTELECHLPDGQDAMPLDVMPLATTWVSGNLQRGSEQAIFTIECVGEQKKWVLAAKSVTLARQWIDALESIGVGRDDSKALAPAAHPRNHVRAVLRHQHAVAIS